MTWRFALTLTLGVALVVGEVRGQFYNAAPTCLPKRTAPSYGFPQLTSLPIGVDSPPDVILGYMKLDSATHRAGRRETIDFVARQTYNDTLKALLKYGYVMADNDPVGFICYLSQYDTSTTVSGNRLRDAVASTLRRTSSTPNEDVFLFCSAWIFKGVVNSVTSGIDSNSTGARQFHSIRFEVLDTIKGKVFPQTVCRNDLIRGKEFGSEQPQAETNCISLELRHNTIESIINASGDTSYARVPAVGDTCFVFAEPIWLCGTPTTTYFFFTPTIGTGAVPYLGLFTIKNGRVFCPNGVFSGSADVTESEFLLSLNRHIARIIGRP